ncbi:MAG TPA: ABC transporter ATP-binding protein [Anaerolineaceae bacterium]|jgi:ATP-binding cassette subfamily B protein|nr:ABC transporter ATP-binding protein [Chloroflexota bacterium]HNS07186.1 ABC transporter ATP-binding protein [Anaerolineaceae bacterium]HNW13106.1 ABC transporter ATP-binding protein [Anaerolineaceae bacterium]HOQ68799.1 ABC transporter ATP-binding protein [Anaerolineaceae bacterium]HPD62616.1 ABC transporter ATP-binding protein [Anaerolineaceae bacterium]
MLRIFRYLKPYTLSVLVVILLLFGQAMAELSLPNYMSKIVNIGIQQGGIENAVPEVLRSSQLERMLLFLTPDEQAAVRAAYTPLEPSSPAYDRLIRRFPAAVSGETLARVDLTPEQIETLNPLSGRALLAVSMLEQAASDPAKAAALSQQSGMDLSRLPAGADVFALLHQLPPERLQQMVSIVRGRFDALDSSMITQAAAAAVKTEYIALGADAQKLQTAYILRIGGKMLLLTLMVALAVIIISLLSARTGAGFARDLRSDIFSKVASFSKAEFESFSTASLITRSTNDVTQMQMVTTMGMRMLFFAPMMAVGAIIRAVEKSPSMTWIIALGVGTLLVMVITIFSVSLPRFQRIQTLIDRLNLVTRENLSGIMVIRAFNSQEFELKRFDKANIDLTENSLFVGRVMVTLFPLMTLIMSGLSLLIIWVGSHQVAASALQVGDMMAFLQYAMQVVFSFLMISMMFIFLPRAAVSGRRIDEVLRVEPAIKDPPQPKPFDSNSRGLVEFRNVSFRYPNAEENVLCNISFTARPGETTAILGGTGSGKSTLVNLIPRFFDVSEGEIYVDGVDVREVAQADLRQRIGYIPQHGVLFTGTVASNLRYGNENATAEELAQAAQTAQAADFIAEMEGGMDAPIAQGGTNVSGGQKQRLAIARALLKHPPIYIFDDALSALDYKTDARLRRALANETNRSTMLIVTQRVSTIKHAEQIVVLDDGEIVGKGTHDQLMQSCETYREMVASQLSGEELLR